MNRRIADLIRAATALVVLLVLVVGVPIALVLAVGSPLPTALPTWDELGRTLMTGELDSWTLVKALAAMVWLAWLHLTISAAAEILAIVRSRRVRRVPGPRGIQLTVANLVATAALLFTGPLRPSQAQVHALSDLRVLVATGDRTANDGADETPVRTSESTSPPVVPSVGTSDGADQPSEVVWVVQPRDTLWDIAERALGNGFRWRDIHRLNVGRPQPDGDALKPNDERIRPGWRLVLPPGAHVTAAASPPDSSASDGTPAVVTVTRGDTLWELADEHLDDPYRWPDLYEANDERTQPDGRRLTDPDLIYPGWQLLIPDQLHESGNGQPPPLLEDNPAPAPQDAASYSAPPTPHASDPTPTSPAPSPSATRAPAQLGDASARHTPHVRSTPDRPAASESDDWADEALLVAGAGLLAAGLAATIDRVRRTQRRRRPAGHRIPLPRGAPATTEKRVRALADHETADHLQRALASLHSFAHGRGTAPPDIILASTSATDVAVHLATADLDPPSGWRVEDAGRSWVIPRDAAADLPEPTATAISTPPPLLVTLGLTAEGHRRVLLNLAHEGIVGLEAEADAAPSVLLAQAAELATSPLPLPLNVIVVGFGEPLAALEQISWVGSANEAIAVLERAAPDPSGSPVEEAAVALFPEPLEDASFRRLRDLVTRGRGALAAVMPARHDLPARISQEDGDWQLLPYGVAFQPVQITAEEIEQLGAVLQTAKSTGYVPAEPSVDPEPKDVPPDDTAEPTTDTVIDLAAEAPGLIEVRVLGPVEVVGAGEFASAKAEELVVYLAMRRARIDADALMEALWPGQPPNPSRLYKAASRARQALGDDPAGEPYLPRSSQGRYELSPRVRLDDDRFRRLVEQARANPEHSTEALRAALELVRGRPLSSTSCEYAWAMYDSHAIQQEICDAAHELARLYLDGDNAAGAIWAAERGLKADPYFEALYRDLMQAAAAAGNTTELRSIMDRVRRVVAEDADENDADDRLDPQTVGLYASLVPGFN